MANEKTTGKPKKNGFSFVANKSNWQLVKNIDRLAALENRKRNDYLNIILAAHVELKGINTEQKILNTIDRMCTESLPPDLSNKWDEVKAELIKNRKNL